MERLYQFFSDKFYAPHGYCFMWLPEIVWLHIIADILIAGSYFSIPLALYKFYRMRPDMPFSKVLVLFATFITLCGLTHVLGIIVMWHPYYGIEGLVMLLTGIVSSITAVFVWKNLPAAMKLPSPAQLQEINRQLSDSYEEVERKVRERTNELEIAMAKADDASEAKSQFLTNMSHEIRTPMNAIIGIANILERNRDLEPDRQYELIQTLKLSSKSLLGLIDDLLDISRIESRNLKLEEIPFSVTDIVNDVYKMMELRASEKNLDFRTELKCVCIEKRTFMGDPTRLRQILINLCGNAIKFTESGGVTISVECIEGSDPSREVVVISVIDTGIGIDEDKQKMVFDKFVQADSSINRKYGGSGLGLTICRDIVTAMKGSISVTSEPGRGSKFTISVPLVIRSR